MFLLNGENCIQIVTVASVQFLATTEYFYSFSHLCPIVLHDCTDVWTMSHYFCAHLLGAADASSLLTIGRTRSLSALLKVDVSHLHYYYCNEGVSQRGFLL